MSVAPGRDGAAPRRLAVVTWPPSAGSRAVALLRHCLPGLAPSALDLADLHPAGPMAAGGGLPEGPCVMEHAPFPAVAVAAFEGALARGEAEDTAAGFRAVASRAWGHHRDVLQAWEAASASGGRLMVALEALEADPVPWIERLAAWIDPGAVLDDEARARAGAAARAWLSAHPRPDPGAHRHVDAALLPLLGRLSLPREAAQETFRAVMGREPGEAAILPMQTAPSVDDLRRGLMDSDEHRATNGKPPLPKAPHLVPVQAATAELEGMRHVMGVSWPRSGHHLLVRLLTLYFGEGFGYCQFYGTDAGCCGAVPCRRADVHLSKSHDFDGEAPQPAGQPVLVQVRAFVPSIVSNFELFVRGGGADSRESFLAFTSAEFSRYRRFAARWVEPTFPEPQLVLRYEDMIGDPLAQLARAVTYLRPGHPFDEARASRAVAEVDGQRVERRDVRLLKNAGVHEGRDVTRFRFYEPALFDAFARLHLDRDAVLEAFARHQGRAPAEDEVLALQVLEDAAALEAALAGGDADPGAAPPRTP